MKNKSLQQDSDHLRSLAETKVVSEQQRDAHNRSAEELMRELQVHQIELEMQNESLRHSQIELEESRDRYVDLYDFSPIGYLTLSSTGMISEANLTAADLLGTKRSNLIKRRFANFVVPADHEKFDQHFLTALQSDEQRHCELSFRRADHSRFDFLLTTRRMESNSGEYAVRIALTDITEHKQAEEKIHNLNQELEEKVQQLLETQKELEQHRVHLEQEVAQRTASLTEAQRIGHFGNWEWDITHDRLIWSDEIYRIFGLAPQQFGATYEAFLNAVHPQDRQRVDDKVREALARQCKYSIEHRIQQPDGTLRYVYEQSEVIRGEDGQPISMLGTVLDITERKQAEAKLRESESAYRTLSQNMPGMVYRLFLREAGRMQFYNEMPVQITGYTADELTAGKLCSIEPLILEECRPGVEAEVRRAIAEKRAFVVEYQLKHKDGGIRWLEEHGMPVYDKDGASLYIDGVIFDITAYKQDEVKLHLFRTLLDNSSDAIEVIDPATMRFLDVNETECRELGYSREEMLSMKISDIDVGLTADQMKDIQAQILANREARFESIHRRKDNTTYPVEAIVKMVEIDIPYTLSIVRDITERKLAEAELQKLQEQLREQALHDPLTGLYNRRYFDEATARELDRAARHKQSIGIVMCDLDHFKLVNDTHGHLAGDEVLRVFAELLKKHARGSDVVCRFGGEEFVMFLPDMSPAITHERAEQLRTELAAKRITIGATVIQVTASFGVANFPENAKTMDSLISAVDAAMYQAKETGRNRIVVASVRAADGVS